MNKLNLWQEYDCPHGSDSDIDEPNLLHHGQKFYCHWCGGEHTAGVDVKVSTTRDWREYLDLPKSASDLKALVEQEVPATGWQPGLAITEEMHIAAVKVLQRAQGIDGLPQRMLDAMLSAARSGNLKGSAP